MSRSPRTSIADSPIGWAALLTAALEVVIIVAGQIGGLDTVENALGLVTGVVLAPIIAIGLGLRLSSVLSGAASVDRPPIATPA